jgi:hypothetical protein
MRVSPRYVFNIAFFFIRRERGLKPRDYVLATTGRTKLVNAR